VFGINQKSRLQTRLTCKDAVPVFEIYAILLPAARVRNKRLRSHLVFVVQSNCCDYRFICSVRQTIVVIPCEPLNAALLILPVESLNQRVSFSPLYVL